MGQPATQKARLERSRHPYQRLIVSLLNAPDRHVRSGGLAQIVRHAAAEVRGLRRRSRRADFARNPPQNFIDITLLDGASCEVCGFDAVEPEDASSVA